MSDMESRFFCYQFSCYHIFVITSRKYNNVIGPFHPIAEGSTA